MDGPNNGIILYHYVFSPVAKRVVWYLTLRGIDYAQALQSHLNERPDLRALGVAYRRIPVMAIGKDVYVDSRIILSKLEQVFPNGRLGAVAPEHKALEKLFEAWTEEGGIFVRASQLIPATMPLLKDPKFKKDREEFSGRAWTPEEIEKNRPEALAHIRNAFRFLENSVLADNRKWVLNTDQPSLADIEAIWPFDWVIGLKGALPKELVSEQSYPKVFAWVKRFNDILQSAKSRVPKPTTLEGDAATERVFASHFVETEGQVDPQDPLGLQKGDEVEVYPIDTGSKHHDRGTLVSLDADEVVITLNSGLRLHAPRTGFRINKISAGIVQRL